MIFYPKSILRRLKLKRRFLLELRLSTKQKITKPQICRTFPISTLEGCPFVILKQLVLINKHIFGLLLIRVYTTQIMLTEQENYSKTVKVIKHGQNLNVSFYSR